MLVPVDFSHCSALGLHYAIKLAHELGAQITILHVVDFGSTLTADGYAMYDLSRYQKFAREEAQRQMKYFLKSIDFQGVKFTSRIVADLFLDGLNGTIANENIDLVVTATHGRTGFKHVLLGSNAELMARRAACPVLIVPSHPKERLQNLGAVVKRHRLETTPRRTTSFTTRSAPESERFTRHFDKMTRHPFPERRKTNKFRESHLVVH
jgi:nucleotide-binding universal stress UspA family protein